MPTMTGVFLTMALSAAAPPPKSTKPPDPLGRGYMGVYPVSSTLVVDRVEPGSPAMQSGLQPGDRFLAVGGFRPGDFDELRSFVMDFRPGTRVEVEVRRRDKTIRTIIRLGTRTEASGSMYPIPVEVEP
jgi:S1-C subfamily serine protease